MSKSIKLFFFLIFSSVIFAQEIKLMNVQKQVESDDASFYRIENVSTATYLGELDVNGFTNKDAEVFSTIYHTAKKIGANAFKYKKIFDVTGESQPFNAHHYKLLLYYLSLDEFPKIENQLYVFGNSKKDLKIKLNSKKRKIEARTFCIIPLQKNEVYTISTSTFLGSSFKFTANENEAVKYYQLYANSLDGNNGFLGFKSADIKMIRRSFADFLTVIYKKEDF